MMEGGENGMGVYMERLLDWGREYTRTARSAFVLHDNVNDYFDELISVWLSWAKICLSRRSDASTRLPSTVQRAFQYSQRASCNIIIDSSRRYLFFRRSHIHRITTIP